MGLFNVSKNRERMKLEMGVEEKKRKLQPLIDFLQSVIIALILSGIIFAILTPSEVDGPSMEPNFYQGERVYTNRLPMLFNGTDLGNTLGLSYQRGEVIVFYKPGMDGSLIKRVIGLPGEELEIKNGNFYINGRKLVENYLPPGTYTKGGTFLPENKLITIPSDSYFISGDNRSVSNDSRYLGFIKKDWMQGDVIFRIWPLDRLTGITVGSYSLE